MRRIVAFAVSLAASVVVVSSPVIAQQPGAGSPARGRMKAMMQRMDQAARWWQNPELAEQVGVTPEQIESLDAMAAEAQEQRLTAARAYAATYARLITALSQAEAKTAAIAERRDELLEAQTAMFAVSVERLLAMHEILTYEQWEKLRQVRPGALQIGQARMRGSGTVSSGDTPPGEPGGKR